MPRERPLEFFGISNDDAQDSINRVVYSLSRTRFLHTTATTPYHSMEPEDTVPLTSHDRVGVNDDEGEFR